MQQELISKARLVVTQLQVSICHDQIRTLHKTSNLKLCLSVTRRTCLCRAYLGCCIKGGDCRLGTARNKRAALITGAPSMSSEVHQTSLLRPVWWDMHENSRRDNIGDGKSASRREQERSSAARRAPTARANGATTLRQKRRCGGFLRGALRVQRPLLP